MTKDTNEEININNSNEQILFLEPVFKERIWGGSHLRDEFNYNIPSDNTGECWGIAAHDNGSSIVKDGIYKGKTLKELFTEKPELFGNIDNDRFPLLVKVIYTKEDCSIQVHPDDEYAKANENGSLGKNECWYILDCEENAEIVLGHNAKTREELKEMIEGSKWDSFISKVPIKKGDFIQIDSGTVHTITGGLMVLETQQNSDVTYRVYDYDRLQNGKPRELHVKESIDVITVPEKDKSEIIKNFSNTAENEMVEMISNSHYTVWKLRVTDTMKVVQDKAFMNMSVVSGEGMVNNYPVKKGDHFLLPSKIAPVTLTGNMTIIASAI
ncbi:MAG: mannose-6-phosphate isomerase, class I [Lachnospiraceae bacterium]|nr:mannose-6-phosphate isomerase, class I [Lachnospiraceae bacterium]